MNQRLASRKKKLATSISKSIGGMSPQKARR